MTSSYLPENFVTRYARPPSQDTLSEAIKAHQSVRDLLGDTDYLTLLQGSYKNDTALWDINDVDIVAISRGLLSSYFNGTKPAPDSGVPWTEIFRRIEQKLQADARYQGRWTRADKCIRLNAGMKVDIVPAVRIGEATSDPIAIYSFRECRERKNWPRGHFESGASKSGRTNGAFKQTVRLFKRWSRCWFSDRTVAPSYYLECLVHSQSDSTFTGNLARDFVTIGQSVGQMVYGASTLPRLVGDGNLLTPEQWNVTEFTSFQRTLERACSLAGAALNATSEEQAKSSWIAAFNGQQST